MAVANVEKLRTISIDPVLTKLRGLFRIHESKDEAVIPWSKIWSSGINPAVIMDTGRLQLWYESALGFYIKHPEMKDAQAEYRQRRKDLLHFLYRNAECRVVYNSLRKTPMFTIGPKETLMEKFQGLSIRGRERLLSRLKI